MILFKAEASPRVQHLAIRGNEKNPELIAMIFRSSTESTISTCLIHNIASEGKPEQELTSVLNHIFLHESVEGVGNLSK